MVHQSTFKIRSSIKPKLLRVTLKKGALIGGAGALTLLLAGTLLPLEQLKIWGLPALVVGFVLISVGLLPYRKLTRLELKPHELHYDGEFFLFLQQGKPLFKIPEESVEKMCYVEKEQMYGIAIWLKRPIEEKVRVLQPHFQFEAFVSDSAQRFEGCDLFLPYFTERSWKELEDYCRQ